MNTETQHGLLALVSVAILRLSLSDAYLRYVKPGLRPWLIVAGALLGLLAVVGLVRAARPGPDAEPVDVDADDEAPHDHSHVPAVAWLLTLPVLAIFLIAPVSLGSYAAGRQDVRVAPRRGGFPALPAPVDGAVPLSLNEYTLRTLYDEKDSLDGQRIRLVGFVSPDPNSSGDTFLLTRFVISCCAADGRPIKVVVRGAPMPLPPSDTWLSVVGERVPPERTADGRVIESRLPVFTAQSVARIREPRQPYE